MLYFPPIRRLLFPALVLLAITVFYKSRHNVPRVMPHLGLFQPSSPEGIHIAIADLHQQRLPLRNASSNHLSPPKQYYYNPKPKGPPFSNSSVSGSGWSQPILNPNLAPIFHCWRKPNRFTDHIRLPHIIRNISLIPPSPIREDTRTFWNPTIISLPYWSTAHYLVVSRILTDGNHQQNVLCEARVCNVGNARKNKTGEITCTGDDLLHLGPAGGMRCVTDPIVLSVPPTPAEHCEGKFESYVNIPGFHDPRLFYSGRGEPLMMVNTQSRYACFGLWIIDVRSLYPPLDKLLASSPVNPSLGPLMSYSSLTELTKNPGENRFHTEKNWMLFFTPTESYIHYEISPRNGRYFSKLLGAGLTTTNLTDSAELPCIPADAPDESEEAKRQGTWHQATNSLRLILCKRFDSNCQPNLENTVFFAIVHRKQINGFKLPMRYERFFIVWSASPPFHMLAISQHPILLANETASGFKAAENWDDDPETPKVAKENWAHFTYTVSIAYAWGREGDEAMWKNTGFLDDEVMLSIGINDVSQGFAIVPVGELLQCMKACPGIDPGLADLKPSDAR